jgi:ElaB/YqjD/DUF883 family membrane-anchored ribosome-binding protein
MSQTEVIRQQMEGTRASLTDKIEQLESQVTDKVEKVTATVADTAEAVEGTVEAVKNTFDLEWHARRHPWMLVGGAVALGFLGALLLPPAPRPRFVTVPRDWQPQPPRAREEIRPTKAQEVEDHLGRQEVSELKQTGVGMAMSVMRHVLASALPPPLGPLLDGAVNAVTTRLGGRPIEATDGARAHQS